MDFELGLHASHHLKNNPPRGKNYKQSPPYRGIFTCIYFLQCLQQWLHTLVKERFLSMLGSQIGPIEQTLVIRQVAREPLPRVIPEKMCIEVSHCYRQDQDTHLYLLEHSMVGLTPYSCNTLVIGLTLQSALTDWWCLHWIPKPADSSIYTR